MASLLKSGLLLSVLALLGSCSEGKMASEPKGAETVVAPSAQPAPASAPPTATPSSIPPEDNGPAEDDVVQDTSGVPGHSLQTPLTPSQVFANKLDTVTAATEGEVFEFLRTNCKGCHGPSSSATSFWTIDFDGLSKSVLRSDADAHVVFQTLVNAVAGYEKPKPMPLGASISGDNQLQAGHLKVLKWYINEIPEVARNAYLEFKLLNPFGDDVSITFDYQCNAPVQFGVYLARVTSDAFGRLPNQTDYAAFSNFGRTAPTTPEMRKAVADRLLADAGWRSEFLNKGLKTFADKLSGSSQIRPSTRSNEIAYSDSNSLFTKEGLTDEEAQAVQQEFYQTLLLNIDPSTGAERKKYSEILLGNEIAVNSVSKRLYECSANTSTGWAMCDMKTPNPKRDSYFTTFSYLAAKTSSMFVENNNYGRTATLYFFIRGQGLKAATNGPTGGAVEPLPACLKSADTRGHLSGENFAPFGTIQIPLTGNVCQGCHIGRNLANGSILFRPFGSWGQSFLHTHFTDQRTTNIPGFSTAVADSVKLRDQPTSANSVQVVANFYADLLDPAKNSEAACLVVDGREVPLNSVKDLASALIGDGRELARGMARHIPRALSNINGTNSELIQEMEEAFVTGDGKLLPMFKAYFASETYACSNDN